MKEKTTIPRDNIDLDVIDAKIAGMSYGQYKAMHPKTKAANDWRLAPKPIVAEKVYEFTCKNCGEKFQTTNSKRRYCGTGCQNKRQALLYRERKRLEVAANV